MSIVTMMTDFGLKDGNVGVMKAVIWGLAPQVQIADISHLIQPQNVVEAALILARIIPYCPSESIHLVVVDPGVGTERRPLAAILGTQRFVLPDNGIITLALERAEKQGLPRRFFHLNQPEYWNTVVSNVFHGRDIFAPVVGHLASGISIESFGKEIDDPIRLHFPQAHKEGDKWRGEVIHIDHFGNISTNIMNDQLGWQPGAMVSVQMNTIQGLVRTFGEKPPGSLVALYGSNGNLIICVVNGNAANELNVRIGDPVEVVV